jgi:phage terminase small subunit
MRSKLLAWQWSDYAAKHRERGNLLIHIVAVPVFLLSMSTLMSGVFAWAPVPIAAGGAVMLLSLIAQALGHKREPEQPAPFEGALDFPARFLSEQWVTFPRFVLSGAWARSFKAAAG